MIEHDAPETTNTSTTAADITGEHRTDHVLPERAKIIQLIAERAPETLDRYADLRSRCGTRSAEALIWRLYADIDLHQQKIGNRVRTRRAKTSVKLFDALERIVGDLLRARAGTNATGRIFRVVGKSSFSDAPVKYDMFTTGLDGLKALGLVGHRKGQTRYFETGFDVRATLPGRAARFWATTKLVKLAEHHGINSGNVGDYFTREPPTNPLVLKDYATGRGRYKESGPVVEYESTPETERLKADIRELNEFLARFELTGARHEGYVRIFNNCSWKNGGRLYSQCEGSYQQLPEQKRLEMMIDGKPVAEIDIKASFLTIYHAKLGKPLDGRSDPYAHAGIAREVAKLWCNASFGKSAPSRRWPAKMVEDYRKSTGQDLRKVAKASKVAEAMLEAFPALRKLEEHPQVWADLQFLEAEAVVGTMLTLMRSHRIPSLSMHDGIIVPRSKAVLAKGILAKEFRRKVGVEPMLTVEPEEVSALDL
jgi:hypothetical protein